MQVKEPQDGHVTQSFPGEGSEGVSIQPKLIQVVEASKTVCIKRVQGIERHPEKLKAVEVVKVVAGNARDCRLLYA